MTLSAEKTDEYLRSFTNYLKRKKLRLTRQRETIARVFLGTSSHNTLEDLYRKVSTEDRRIGQSTLYRTMKLLVDSGLAHDHNFADEPTRFEVAYKGEHHDHLICVECGKIMEFEDDMIERRQERIASSLGFKLVSHRHEIYGECLNEGCPEREKNR